MAWTNTSQKSSKPNFFNSENKSHEFHAICSEGLLSFLKEEVLSHNLDIESENRGGIFFTGELSDVFQFLASTEVSSKVGVSLAGFSILDLDEFYDKAVELPWEKVLGPRTKFKIEGKTKDCLPDSRFAIYKLKDAILDHFRNIEAPFPDVDLESPDVVLNLRSFQNQVRIELLLHKSSLTKRGYRERAGDATLRENIAAGLLKFSGWKENAILIDPYCGQGTILIEAALKLKMGFYKNKNKFLAKRILINLFPDFDFENFLPESKIEAQSKPLLIGLDISSQAIEQAKLDAKKAGVEDWIHFTEGNLHELSFLLNEYPADLEKFIVTDPPFGKRLGTREDAVAIYAELGAFLKENIKPSHLCIITSDPSLLGHLKLKKDAELSLKNSNLKSKMVKYKIEWKPEKS